MMLQAGLVIGIFIFAVGALRSTRLLISAIWLACASGLTAILLYTIGGREIAVVELSVGAGLVTVLFAFALSLVGEDLHEVYIVIPRPLALALAFHVLILVVWAAFPLNVPAVPIAEPPYTTILWQDRGLDVILQIALIFTGALGVLGILAESRTRHEGSAAGIVITPITIKPVPVPPVSEPEAPLAEREREETPV